jgi:hypothetical protein
MILNSNIMSDKFNVTIQPEGVSKTLNKEEISQLTTIIDKLLQNGIQLEVNYTLIPKSV